MVCDEILLDTLFKGKLKANQTRNASATSEKRVSATQRWRMMIMMMMKDEGGDE